MMASCEATYEEREQLIEEFKAKIALARRVTRCLRRLKEHDAEAEAAKAKLEEQWKQLREDDKRMRELMESGERFRKYRKQAQATPRPRRSLSALASPSPSLPNVV